MSVAHVHKFPTRSPASQTQGGRDKPATTQGKVWIPAPTDTLNRTQSFNLLQSARIPEPRSKLCGLVSRRSVQPPLPSLDCTIRIVLPFGLPDPLAEMDSPLPKMNSPLAKIYAPSLQNGLTLWPKRTLLPKNGLTPSPKGTSPSLQWAHPSPKWPPPSRQNGLTRCCTGHGLAMAATSQAVISMPLSCSRQPSCDQSNVPADRCWKNPPRFLAGEVTYRQTSPL